jgi:transcriptional regulator with PAS, ATPase and Fis domain
LKAQPWPGNIRELQNVMERALILSEEQGAVRPEHLLLATNGIL